MKFIGGLGKLLGRPACEKGSHGLSAREAARSSRSAPDCGAGVTLVSRLKVRFSCSVIQCRRHKGAKFVYGAVRGGQEPGNDHQ